MNAVRSETRGRLLHVVGHDHDRVVAPCSSQHQLLDRARSRSGRAPRPARPSAAPRARPRGARAMQSRCCWPPERPSAELSQPVLHLVPQRRALRRLRLDPRLELAAVAHAEQRAARRRRCRRSTWGTGSARWNTMPTRRRSSTTSVPGGQHVHARRPRPARVRTPGIRSFMRLNERSSVLLPQPDGPMIAVMLCCPAPGFTALSA